MAPKLTPRQRKFVAAFDGNATDAARKAGYNGDGNTLGQTAHQLLKNPKVAAELGKRETKVVQGLIADRAERQAFWSAAMREAAHDIGARLKASEVLGKSEGDFVERHEHNVVTTITVIDPYAGKP